MLVCILYMHIISTGLYVVCAVCASCIVCIHAHVYVYLLQVRSRSHSIWGGEEGLSAEQEKKSRHKEKLKQNKYEKKIKGM